MAQATQEQDAFLPSLDGPQPVHTKNNDRGNDCKRKSRRQSSMAEEWLCASSQS